MAVVHTIDLLGEPYVAETLALPPDDEGEVVATLVSRRAAAQTHRAVLHVHGFNDYFFQTVAADFWVDRGYDFYALDLRKYGRSLRPHQTPNFVTDLAEYFTDLDLDLERVRARDGHEEVVVSAHSTGGLISALWLDARRSAGYQGVRALVLNSPWLDLHGPLWLRTVGTRLVDRVGARQPMWELRRSVTGLYGASLHSEHGGEWDYDLTWKPLQSWPVRLGWLRAVRRGHAAISRGLSLDIPTLVLSSDRSCHSRVWEPDIDCTDTVLDVELIARRAPLLSTHLTLVRVPGALHDVTLSREPARSRAFDELARWLTAYVDRPA